MKLLDGFMQIFNSVLHVVFLVISQMCSLEGWLINKFIPKKKKNKREKIRKILSSMK